MEETNKHNYQMQINDLIDDAINNAIARRSLAQEDLTTLPDAEITKVMGGQLLAKDITILGYKPIQPICLPTKPPIIIKPPIKPICPPIIMGLIALEPDSDKLPLS